MRLVTARALSLAVPVPARDPIVPAPLLSAPCVTPTRHGWPAVPHLTHRVAAGVVSCALCGSLWTEGVGVLPPLVQLVLVEREWRRLAVERRSAVAGHAVRPFLEWFDPMAVWGWAEDNLGAAAALVFVVSFALTRWVR